MGAGRPWRQALAWKDYHFLSGGKRMAWTKFLLYVAGVYGLLLWMASLPFNRISLEEIGATHFIAGLVILGVEATLLAGRVLSEELRWQTWSTLVLLPRSVGSIVGEKLLGYGLSLVPGLFFVVVGMLLMPNFGREARDVLNEEGFWLCVTVVALFLEVVLLMSLYLRWGAVPATFGLGMVYVTLLGSMLGPRGEVVPMLVLNLLACAALPPIILARLRSLAAR